MTTDRYLFKLCHTIARHIANHTSWVYEVHIHSYGMGGDLFTIAACLNIIIEKK